jgi:hypothetical protein
MRMESKTRYDFSTAVTFFLAGLGVGSLVALILSSRARFLVDPADAEPARNSQRVPAL